MKAYNVYRVYLQHVTIDDCRTYFETIAETENSAAVKAARLYPDMLIVDVELTDTFYQ